MYCFWQRLIWELGFLQLRNILWATSKHDVYLMQNYSVMHWSSLLRRGKEVLNVVGQIVPAKVVFLASEFILCSCWLAVISVGYLLLTEAPWFLSTITIKGTDKYDGCKGQLNGSWWFSRRAYLQGMMYQWYPTICWFHLGWYDWVLDSWFFPVFESAWSGLLHKNNYRCQCHHQCSRYISIFPVKMWLDCIKQVLASPEDSLLRLLSNCLLSGSNRVMTANNDCCVRVFDTEKSMLLNHLSFSWSVNVSIPLVFLVLHLLSLEYSLASILSIIFLNRVLRLAQMANFFLSLGTVPIVS